MDTNQTEGILRELGRKTSLMTRKVKVGSVSIGGNSPVRIQSMTTTKTGDILASIAQSISMIKAGSELVRLTAPSIKDADALEVIVAGVRTAGFSTPFVADIHFTPNAAFRAADFVEKIRINPGNFADKKKFDHHEYTDASYAEELVRIRDKFTPLVVKCKELGRVMRIGTNHGSLSDRITSRFGDTPLGMVESALEFIRICRDNDYHELVISMKSSNTGVMVEAYRMLVRRMADEGMNYPLHLGVTEAGDGEDGRIKSAIGIGTLLEEGIGDTIRVSLTEAPEAELPVARAIVDRYVDHVGTAVGEDEQKRISDELGNVGHKNVPVVVATLIDRGPVTVANLMGIGYIYSVPDDKWHIADQACDFVYSGDRLVEFPLPGTLKVIVNGAVWEEGIESHLPIWSIEEFKSLGENVGSTINHFLSLNTDEVDEFLGLNSIRKNCVIVLSSNIAKPLSNLRLAIAKVEKSGGQWPLILRNTIEGEGIDNFTLYQSIDSGGLLLDGKLDGLWIDGSGVSLACISQWSLSFCVINHLR